MSNQITSNGCFEVYDGNMVHQMGSCSIEDELLTPPGAPSPHPRGCHKRLAFYDKVKQDPPKSQLAMDLPNKLQFNNSSETKYNEDASMKPVTEEQEDKDSLIRHLQRKVTILQANIYRNEAKFDELTQEKNRVDNKLELMALQCDAAKRETLSMREQFMRQINDLDHMVKQKEEIERLTQERRADKEKIAQLEKEKRETTSPPSSYSQMSGASLKSWSSNPNYGKELEYLHEMVDMLRATVLQQRDVFIKMRSQSHSFNSLPQAQSATLSTTETSQTSISPNPPKGSNNISTTKTASLATPPAVTLTSQSLRQASAPPDMGTMSDVKLHPQPSNNGMTKSQQNGHLHQRNENLNGQASQGVMEVNLMNDTPTIGTAGFSNLQHIFAPGGIHQGIGYVRDMGNGAGELQVRLGGAGENRPTSPRPHVWSVGTAAGAMAEDSQGNGIYVNVKDSELNMRHQGQRDSSNLVRDSSSVDLQPYNTNGSSSPKCPARKTSQSEIINRKPQLLGGASLPVKSQTELLRRNPRSKSAPQVLAYPTDYSDLLKTASTSARFNEAQKVQDVLLQYRPLPAPVPVYEDSTVNVPPNYSNMLNSDTRNTLPLPPPRMGRSPDDRLCPVCNHTFDHIRMEDFQTHVFDCFDNENGPETLLPDISDYPPLVTAGNSRTCPMCQQKFEVSISQTEFEQHVHRHFGEESFEVLRP